MIDSNGFSYLIDCQFLFLDDLSYCFLNIVHVFYITLNDLFVKSFLQKAPL
jgi:hypothetical protein